MRIFNKKQKIHNLPIRTIRTSALILFGLIIPTQLLLLHTHGKSSIALDLSLFQYSNSGIPEPSLQIEKVCPASSNINSKNNHVPPSRLMQLQEVRDMAKNWHASNCPGSETCKFASIGQNLLHHAIQRNETLLTVQVGAMDGVSNDPMYKMFVQEKPIQYVSSWRSFASLNNWLPVMIEPVPINYEALIETYADIATERGLGCAVPIHAAVSYDATKTSCPFCRVNTSDNAPDVCKSMPDWKRLQLGTLDCEESKHYFKKRFDLCVVQDPVPCTSIVNLLRERNISNTDNIAILQVDIEGYEYILLEGFFKEIADESLPPIIHFEHKTMMHWDKKRPLEGEDSSRLGSVTELLTGRGYVLINVGEDYLAIRIVY